MPNLFLAIDEAKHSRNNILKCGNSEYSFPINEAKHSRNNSLKCGIRSTPLLSKQVLQDNFKRNTSNDPYLNFLSSLLLKSL